MTTARRRRGWRSIDRARPAAGLIALAGLTGFVTAAGVAAGSDRVSWFEVGWPWQLVTMVWMMTGLLIVRARPDNLVGWLFLVLGADESIVEAAAGVHDLLGGPGSSWWITGGDVVVTANTAMIPVILLLFPDGRLLARGWRVGVALALSAAAVGSAGALLNGGWAGQQAPEDALSPIAGRLPALGAALHELFFPLLAGALATAGVSLLVRFRRSRGVERLQLRWLAAAGALILLVGPPYILGRGENPVAQGLFLAALLLVSMAVGVAVLRYRLYDIDVVINRTLVYGALTATLAASYFAGVLVLQTVLSPLTENSDLAVAGSTLAVAALFRPVRTRIRAAVDHRFFRRRYDAARTLEAFTHRRREQLDLAALSSDLVDVVRETVQPTQVSLWLRP